VSVPLGAGVAWFSLSSMLWAADPFVRLGVGVLDRCFCRLTCPFFCGFGWLWLVALCVFRKIPSFAGWSSRWCAGCLIGAGRSVGGGSLWNIEFDGWWGSWCASCAALEALCHVGVRVGVSWCSGGWVGR